MTNPDEQRRYRAAWNDLHHRRRNRWIAFAAWAPVTFALRYALEAVAGQDFADTYILPLAVVCMAVSFGFALYPALFRCPRCGENFKEVRMLNSFQERQEDRCQKCNLAVDEIPA